MQKTPDDVTKGLECCGTGKYGNHKDCPYDIAEPQCMQRLLADAIALIQQLQAENAEKDQRIRQLEEERDAAITFLPRKCYLCKHVGNKMGDAPCPSLCKYITLDECPNWQWRGVTKEG